MITSFLLPASLPAIVIGAVSGGVGGGFGTIAYNSLTKRPIDTGLGLGIAIGVFSGGIAAELTPVRPGPQPGKSWMKGWPLPGSYAGKKSIDVVLEEVVQDTVSAFAAIFGVSTIDSPTLDSALPTHLYWEPR